MHEFTRKILYYNKAASFIAYITTKSINYATSEH